MQFGFEGLNDLGFLAHQRDQIRRNVEFARVGQVSIDDDKWTHVAGGKFGCNVSEMQENFTVRADVAVDFARVTPEGVHGVHGRHSNTALNDRELAQMNMLARWLLRKDHAKTSKGTRRRGDRERTAQDQAAVANLHANHRPAEHPADHLHVPGAGRVLRAI